MNCDFIIGIGVGMLLTVVLSLISHKIRHNTWFAVPRDTNGQEA